MERYEIIIRGNASTKKKTNVAGEDKKDKDTNVAGDQDTQKEKNQTKDATAKVIAKTALNEAKTLIIPRIGAYARDSLLQERIDDTISLIDTAFAFAINPVYGAINIATKQVSSLLTFALNNQKEQVRINVAMRRASYINRSRD